MSSLSNGIVWDSDNKALNSQQTNGKVATHGVSTLTSRGGGLRTRGCCSKVRNYPNLAGKFLSIYCVVDDPSKFGEFGRRRLGLINDQSINQSWLLDNLL
jgi:hypothetical protein